MLREEADELEKERDDLTARLASLKKEYDAVVAQTKALQEAQVAEGMGETGNADGASDRGVVDETKSSRVLELEEEVMRLKESLIEAEQEVLRLRPQVGELVERNARLENQVYRMEEVRRKRMDLDTLVHFFSPAFPPPTAATNV